MRNQIYNGTTTILRVLSNNIGATYISSNNLFQIRCFTKKNVPGAPAASSATNLKGPKLDKTLIPVEKDPERLINYVCGTDFMKEDTGPIKIKDDSEYPDWLWEVRLVEAPPLEEVDKNTKTYWRRYFKHVRMYRARVKKFPVRL